MMTRIKSRHWLPLVALVAVLALATLLAACGGDTTTTTAPSTTASSGSATTAASTASTAASTGSTTASTGASTDTTSTKVVQGGKTLQEYTDSIPNLQKAIAANPQDLDSLEQLGVAEYQLGDYSAAEDAYNKILAITTDKASQAFITNALGNAYRDEKNYDTAIEQYTRAIQLDPTLKYPYINLAGVYKTLGQLDKATAILQEAQKALSTDDAKTAADYAKMITSTTTTAK